MTIEIRELTIKTTMVDRKQQEIKGQKLRMIDPQVQSYNEEAIIRKCTDKILEIINDKLEP